MDYWILSDAGDELSGPYHDRDRAIGALAPVAATEGCDVELFETDDDGVTTSTGWRATTGATAPEHQPAPRVSR
jgi:hypothetical protein